ncbi:hypothetical protein [Macrococcus equipercicus]|uniref:Poly-beta-1,6-N-acetyl-D-glucosamine biosynthesis protein PgaD n=1 Tax=Macrococcus equipercicus TaxID=69967 RepID=A0A9Q9BQ36_9STAP|nr:hypothetical protein [Macrococcus equipercicus]UTH13591.1 hypothetical protein KFV11_10255 [Macrococcus equipercicus]
MVKSRQRKQRRNDLIVRTKKNPVIETVLFILSILLWFYVLYAVTFFVAAFFNLPVDIVNIVKIILNLKNKDIISFSLSLLYYTLFIFGALYFWGLYNKLRYGRLNRRKYPGPTTEEELMQLDYISHDIYVQLQQAKTITFKQNPIVDKKVKS